MGADYAACGGEIKRYLPVCPNPRSPRSVRMRPLGHGRGAAIPSDGSCARCVHGEEAAKCTCPVEDRCSNRSSAGHQCIKGAGHLPGSKCVTSAGMFFR
mgnify:CR=1 FL=1